MRTSMDAYNTGNQVADFLLKLHAETYKNLQLPYEPMTNSKLQKLLYYAQTTYRNMWMEELFHDTFTFESYGPKYLSVWHTYEDDIIEEVAQMAVKPLSSEVQSFLTNIYKTWAPYSDYGLYLNLLKDYHEDLTDHHKDKELQPL